MRIYDHYVVIMASLLLITTVVLALLNETRLDLYFTIYLIEILVVNELFIYLNPKAKKSLNAVNYVLFTGFLFLVTTEVIEILYGIELL